MGLTNRGAAIHGRPLGRLRGGREISVLEYMGDVSFPVILSSPPGPVHGSQTCAGLLAGSARPAVRRPHPEPGFPSPEGEPCPRPRSPRASLPRAWGPQRHADVTFQLHPGRALGIRPLRVPKDASPLGSQLCAQGAQTCSGESYDYLNAGDFFKFLLFFCNRYFSSMYAHIPMHFLKTSISKDIRHNLNTIVGYLNID